MPLIKLLDSKNGSLQHNAAFALYGLADNEVKFCHFIYCTLPACRQFVTPKCYLLELIVNFCFRIMLLTLSRLEVFKNFRMENSLFK